MGGGAAEIHNIRVTASAGPTALILGAFGPAPELLARELRSLGGSPVFLERAPPPEEAAALYFFCSEDAGERLGARLAAAAAAAAAARVRKVVLVRLDPPARDGLAAEATLRRICAEAGAAFEVVPVGDGDGGAAFARRLAAFLLVR